MKEHADTLLEMPSHVLDGAIEKPNRSVLLPVRRPRPSVKRFGPPPSGRT